MIQSGCRMFGSLGGTALAKFSMRLCGAIVRNHMVSLQSHDFRPLQLVEDQGPSDSNLLFDQRWKAAEQRVCSRMSAAVVHHQDGMFTRK
jgi:hypothetical protein